ncbi:hypothetical protein LIY46_05885 [Fusobacterium varium]
MTQKYIQVHTALREKILYLTLIMFVLAFSSKISLLSRNNNYKVGDVVISDIYAPKTIVFRDQTAKEKNSRRDDTESRKRSIFIQQMQEEYILKLLMISLMIYTQ